MSDQIAYWLVTVSGNGFNTTVKTTTTSAQIVTGKKGKFTVAVRAVNLWGQSNATTATVSLASRTQPI